jgi:hypothetical protein
MRWLAVLGLGIAGCGGSTAGTLDVATDPVALAQSSSTSASSTASSDPPSASASSTSASQSTASGLPTLNGSSSSTSTSSDPPDADIDGGTDVDAAPQYSGPCPGIVPAEYFVSLATTYHEVFGPPCSSTNEYFGPPENANEWQFFATLADAGSMQMIATCFESGGSPSDACPSDFDHIATN